MYHNPYRNGISVFEEGAKPEYLEENSREENLHQIQAQWNSIQTTMLEGVCSTCNNSAIHILLALLKM